MISIGEASELTGVPASSLRYYDAVGLLTPARDNGGCRRYDDGTVRRITAIKLAPRFGFSLDEIGELLEGGTERWRALVETKISEVRQRIDDATTLERILVDSLHCGCEAWDTCPLISPGVVSTVPAQEAAAVLDGETIDGRHDSFG